jgi:general secretion pathway protein E
MTDFSALLNRLPEEARLQIEEVARQERISRLSRLMGKPESVVLEEVAKAAHIPLLASWEIHGEPTEVIPLRLIDEYQCLPLADQPHSHEIALVTVWPPNASMQRWIYATTGKHPRWYLARPQTVSEKITQSFGVGAGSLQESQLEKMGESENEMAESEDENAAIIRFVNEIILRAIQDHATDIHFEPQKNTLQIRFRVDGELIPVSLPPNLVRVQGAIISRLKIMAKLNISEKRRPQDGRIGFENAGEKLDIRLSTLPTLYGESISLRLLSQKAQPLSIQELGYFEKDEAMIARSLQRPHGIILVTGPTGSGKSTTLTAFIRKVRRPELRIMTVEDPIEYEVAGVNQTQVHHEIGLNFANVLRHILRQDPDVIMVGEVRDRETAEIAIRAALTGHMVLSTLHTNDAPGALTRLIDMEIEPFLVASSVEMIIAQRLVRRLCPYCSKPAEYTFEQLKVSLMALGIPESEMKNAHLLKEPSGCEACRKLGYRGRVAIYEILRVSEAVHELIVQKGSARLIREQAIKEGMRTLPACGWEQAKAGVTSLSEVMQFSEILD